MAAPKSKQETMRPAAFAKGGSGPTNKMFKSQAAGPARAAHTGKAATAAPGAKAPRGGPPLRGVSSSVPANAGATGNVPIGRKGR
jgi:hypothetical protein